MNQKFGPKRNDQVLSVKPVVKSLKRVAIRHLLLVVMKKNANVVMLVLLIIL